jgi:sarcosine oxidase subunit gamma
MAEHYLRQSGLVHLHLATATATGGDGDAGVRLGEKPFLGQLNLRGAGKAWRDAIAKPLGFALPSQPNTVAGNDDLEKGPRALWLGPDEWLVVTAPEAEDALAGELEKAIGKRHASVVSVGEGRSVITIAGAEARRVLAKGCSLDLHPRVFAPGQCAQSVLAQATVIVHQTTDEPAFDIYVARSFAGYLWEWLVDASLEVGYQIVED